VAKSIEALSQAIEALAEAVRQQRGNTNDA
jgi:hypothetical protein